MTPTVHQLYDVCEATWPPASTQRENGWTHRDGAGGGKRVSATTQADPDAEPTPDTAALYMIRQGEDVLDQKLDALGYEVVDPVNLYLCPIARLTDIPIPRVTAFEIWEPLAIMQEIWATGGIGADRVAVMHRAKSKTAIFSRWNEQPAGVAFAGLHEGICMVHAVEVLAHQRRNGIAAWMMRKAAFWAADQGAAHMSVLCTQANTAANGLYTSLGMSVMGQYHYRQRKA